MAETGPDQRWKVCDLQEMLILPGCVGYLPLVIGRGWLHRVWNWECSQSLEGGGCIGYGIGSAAVWVSVIGRGWLHRVWNWECSCVSGVWNWDCSCAWLSVQENGLAPGNGSGNVTSHYNSNCMRHVPSFSALDPDHTKTFHH